MATKQKATSEETEQSKKSDKRASVKRVIELTMRLLNGEKITYNRWLVIAGKTTKQANGKDRTFWRDIADIAAQLSETGYAKQLLRPDRDPNVPANEKIYQLVSTPDAAKLTQVIALAHIVLASRALNKTEMAQLVHVLQDTLALNEQEQFKLAIAGDQGSYVTSPRRPPLLDYLRQITEAIARQQRLVFAYRNAEGTPKKHEAQPETFFFDNYYFYVVMRLTPDADVLMFRLDRITAIDQVKPGMAPQQQFRLREYRQQTYLLAVGEPIVFRFKCWIAAQTALERFPGSTARVDPKTGVVVITAQAREKGALMWLLSQGADVQVIAPPSLIKKIKAHHLAAVERYN
ncbi:helix-turn-helix transcriptional regulator [Loigolactobacillus binensis]|uniref:Helix-turn-helix transcriptional regulator n=1 Tax=Loigolactobacillus binensis TaxID=2559922 RepID=A0ABW3EG24_9LACO|nr:WYL domain-containing protein [Loigolactobacillus binensis]